MLWYVPGQGIVDDSQEGVSIPEPGEMRLPSGETLTWGVQGTQKLPEYRNTWQYGEGPFQWDPQHYGAGQGPSGSYNVGYIPSLIDAAEALRLGSPMPDYERAQVEQMLQAARSTPMRDLSQLQAGYPGEGGDLSRYLTPASPDAGAVMLALRDRVQGGQASAQERGLYDTFLAQMREQDARANVPQASDVGFGLGDNLTGALGVLALGATGGLAAAPLFAGGAGLATTLGSLGTLSGIAGTGASVLGGATGQEWLSKAGLGLGALGGILGGVGGLANLWGTGVQSLSDAARLVSSAGKITGALGSASGSDALRQAGRYLGQAGQLGSFGAGVLPTSVTDWSGDSAPWAAHVAPGVSNLLSAADMATERGGGGMEWDYSNDWGASAPYENWSWDAGATSPSAWDTFTGWGDPYGPGSSGDAGFSGEGSGGWLSTLGGLAGAAGKFLGSNASWLGPAASALGGLGAGALGSRASSDAAALQAAALNRGLDLQTAQWLQQQANQAPWLQAGQQALPQLQQWAGQGPPTFQQPGLPGTQPFQYSGPGMPGQGFQYTGAGMPQTGFQYTGPGMPDTGFQSTGPGMPDTGFQYTNQMPTQDFQAPTFEALKARDPGIQARLDEARNALEASALARGTGMSGSTLGALQRQSQTLASQEYQPAYLRALGEYQQEYGQDWQRQQETYQRALAQNQQLYGRQYQQQADIYGRQLGENQQQYNRAYQQQGDIYGRQLAENQLGYNRQWQQQDTDYQRQLAQNQLLYGRGMEQYTLGYGEQAALNQQDYARNQALYQQQYQAMMDQYNAQRQGQNTAWNQFASLAGLGQTAVGQLGSAGQNITNQQTALLGQLGSAQGMGVLGSAANWNRAIGGVTNNLSDLLAGLNS